MKTIDVVKLALAGKSTEEIRELAALQEELDAKEAAPAPDPVEEEPQEEEKDETEKAPERNEEIEQLKKEMEETKKQLEEARKANLTRDISGRSKDEPTDQDRVNAWISSYM